jgi:hypothetical protein
MKLAAIALGLLACSTAAKPLALTVAAGSKLPAEVIGDFRCSSDTYRSQLEMFADGRYRETEMLTRHGNHWEPIVMKSEPCDPMGRAAYTDGTLSLQFQWASCKDLEDPGNYPMHLRELKLATADSSGFSDGDIRCRREGVQ